MSLNVEKSKILYMKGGASCESGYSLELSQQKDLGVIISGNLSLSDYCSRRNQGLDMRRSCWLQSATTKTRRLKLKFALDSNDKPKPGSTETVENEIFEVPFNWLKKTDKSFWTRTARLMNILNKHIPENELTKSRLTKMYHKFFDRSYNEMEPCT